MLCSNCSAVDVRPIVAIDIDGTLADYHGWFVQFARRYLHQEMEQLDKYDGTYPFREWFCQQFGVTETVWHDVKLAYRQGAQKRMQPAFPGAGFFVDSLHAFDVEVWLTTTRPYLRLDNIDPDTRDWLAFHNIKYHGLIYDDDKYQILYNNVDKQRVIAILEDTAEQYEAAMALFGHTVPILMRNSWNSGVRAVIEATTLSSALNLIGTRARGWRNGYE